MTETRQPLFKVDDLAIIINDHGRKQPAQQGTVIKVGRRWATVEVAFAPDGRFKREYQVDKFDGVGKYDRGSGWSYHRGYTPETLETSYRRAQAEDRLMALTRNPYWTKKLDLDQIKAIIETITGEPYAPETSAVEQAKVSGTG